MNFNIIEEFSLLNILLLLLIVFQNKCTNDDRIYNDNEEVKINFRLVNIEPFFRKSNFNKKQATSLFRG